MLGYEYPYPFEGVTAHSLHRRRESTPKRKTPEKGIKITLFNDVGPTSAPSTYNMIKMLKT